MQNISMGSADGWQATAKILNHKTEHVSYVKFDMHHAHFKHLLMLCLIQ